MISLMAARGRRHRGNTSRYDRASGLPYKISVTFSPDDAVKLLDAMDALDVSASGVVDVLMARFTIGTKSCRIEAATIPRAEGVDPLPLASGG